MARKFLNFSTDNLPHTLFFTLDPPVLSRIFIFHTPVFRIVARAGYDLVSAPAQLEAAEAEYGTGAAAGEYAGVWRQADNLASRTTGDNLKR